MNELQELCKKEAAGEITKSQSTEKTNDILMEARASMTDEDFLKVQREVLAMHHALAEALSGDGYHISGNDLYGSPLPVFFPTEGSPDSQSATSRLSAIPKIKSFEGHWIILRLYTIGNT